MKNKAKLIIYLHPARLTTLNIPSSKFRKWLFFRLYKVEIHDKNETPYDIDNISNEVNTIELEELKKVKYEPVRPNETITLGIRTQDNYDGHLQYIPTMQDVADKKTEWFDELNKAGSDYDSNVGRSPK